MFARRDTHGHKPVQRLESKLDVIFARIALQLRRFLASERQAERAQHPEPRNRRGAYNGNDLNFIHWGGERRERLNFVGPDGDPAINDLLLANAFVGVPLNLVPVQCSRGRKFPLHWNIGKGTQQRQQGRASLQATEFSSPTNVTRANSHTPNTLRRTL